MSHVPCRAGLGVRGAALFDSSWPSKGKRVAWKSVGSQIRISLSLTVEDTVVEVPGGEITNETSSETSRVLCTLSLWLSLALYFFQHIISWQELDDYIIIERVYPDLVSKALPCASVELNDLQDFSDFLQGCRWLLHFVPKTNQEQRGTDRTDRVPRVFYGCGTSPGDVSGQDGKKETHQGSTCSLHRCS